MIEMQLEGVRVELPTNQPIVLLRERDGERYLPIWIGASEAAAIALSLQGVQTPRPMTHDLMKNILEDLSVAVQKIVVTELRDSTFYATIELQRNGDHYEVSSRPSDAIALAVRLAVPIFASEDVWAFDQTWISLAFLVWIAMNGVFHAMVFPSRRRGRADRAPLGIAILNVLLVVMLWLMIWKPGL